jgi:hypothetical protein
MNTNLEKNGNLNLQILRSLGMRGIRRRRRVDSWEDHLHSTTFTFTHVQILATPSTVSIYTIYILHPHTTHSLTHLKKI